MQEPIGICKIIGTNLYLGVIEKCYDFRFKGMNILEDKRKFKSLNLYIPETCSSCTMKPVKEAHLSVLLAKNLNNKLKSYQCPNYQTPSDRSDRDK